MTSLSRRGCYGLTITGLAPIVSALLPDSRADAPSVEVTWARRPPTEDGPDVFGPDRIEVGLMGGRMVVTRDPLRISYELDEEVPAEAILHPYLAPAAALISEWLGRPTFHAGCFVTGAGAWGVVCEKEGGKSSTLAWLAGSGVPVLTDDLLVLEDMRVLPGPPFVDLRPDAARRLGVGACMGIYGDRERWRLLVPPSPEPVPLRGWVLPVWGDRIAVRRIPFRELVGRLSAQRYATLGPPDPTVALDTASLPAFELRRPADWSSFEPALCALSSEIGHI